jgi:iron only hydrogenase large subunit-like protein
MLVTSQSREEVASAFREHARPVAVTISDESAASVAAHFGISLHDALRTISGFFRSLGATWVVDLRWALAVSVQQTALEYVRRVREAPNTLPLIVSSCPGWVCYCEKQHPQLIPYLCPVMSAQGVAGRYLKQHVDPRAFHVSIQPCFDRKLEAAREGEDRSTDCVLSSFELLEWMQELDQRHLWDGPLDSAPLDFLGRDADPSWQGSGGYHQYALQFAAEAMALCTGPIPVRYERRRNANHQHVTTPVLEGVTFCVAYGFQHIQNIVRGLKRPTPSTPVYHFIEVMACPEGCLNGGGQIRGSAGAQELRLVEVKNCFTQYIKHLQEAENSVSAKSSAKRQRIWDEEDHNSSLPPPFTRASVLSVLKSPSQFCMTFVDRKLEMEALQSQVHSLRW